jgi:hypothetical protein
MVINKHRPGPGVQLITVESSDPPEGHVLIQLEQHETNRCSGSSVIW